jgi:aryl-alcohol dehydrogenase-like predicted oxidoreductase
MCTEVCSPIGVLSGRGNRSTHTEGTVPYLKIGRRFWLCQSKRLEPKGEQLPASFVLSRFTIPRQHIFDSVKHSLERLQLDYIDILQCMGSVEDI